MMNMMTGAVAINGGVGVMEIRQPKMAEVVEQVSTVAADITQNAHITLHELKEKIDAVVEQKLPTFKTLMEQKPVAVAQTTVNDASLTVYENGYAVYGNIPDVLSQLIRTMLIPKDGCEFIVADFSAIEARVLAWEAGEQWVLDAFQNGEDLYCATASQMFHVPVVMHGVNGELRQKGKIATLACGYGGSSGALISMGALQMGLKEDELPEIIDSWREANPQIVQYWWDTEKAAMTAFKTGERQEIGKIAFEFYSGTLWMVLPSGRRLAYLKPRQQPNRFGRMSLTYEGVGTNHKWSRQETYSGRLVENATQAIARDILAEAMDRISAHGLNIVAHVHDEVIIEAPKDQYTVEEICKLMSENPAWCKGLPLAAAGYKGNYYFKD